MGVPEDPVCGSGNIAFAYLRAKTAKVVRNYRAKQGQEIGRDGEIDIAYIDNATIELGGNTVITARGELYE